MNYKADLVNFYIIAASEFLTLAPLEENIGLKSLQFFQETQQTENIAFKQFYY
jgi:hypothetical protein